MKLSDLSQVIEINEKSMPETYPCDFWIQKFYQGKNHCFVAVHSAAIIGYILCDGARITSFAIDEKYRSKGIGKILIQQCLNTIQQLYVTLHVRVGNAVAIKLYTSLNFVIEETVPNYYQTPDEDAYLMKWKSNGPRFPDRKKLTLL